MRTRIPLIAAAFLLAPAASHSEPASPGQGPAAVLGVMERVAGWQLAHPSNHPATDWTQGAGDAGFMALAGISGDPRYRKAMLAVGEETQWQPGPRFYHADDYCVGQTYAELYLLYREPRMIAGLRARFDAILGKPTEVKSMEFGQPGHESTQRWSWCDSLFMGPPAWMRLYRATGDARYMDFAVRNWWLTTDYLYDQNEHLFFRDSTYFSKREANGRKVFWSRGNGWVMAGLVRVLQSLPTNHPDRPRFERLFAQMAAKVASCQQADGLWRASLLDPASFPLQETSGSGFFTYALAWGVNEGLLDSAPYSGVVSRAWAGLGRSVAADGRLTHVQPIGADPKNFPGDSTEVYGVGAFLLAGSEVYKMALAMPGQAMSASALAPVRVTNPSTFFRGEETVRVDLGRHPGTLAVMDATSSRILDSQAYAQEPGQEPDRLLFQVDLAPGETRSFLLVDRSGYPLAAPPPVIRTYARQVPERYNDLAWESDRIAHRMYSQELIKGEGTISSGIDVWAKRTRSLVVNEWYQRVHYHQDDGDGLDDYQVGRSRGCGGLGIWSAGRLYVSSNFTGARIITTGPIRSEFELAYDSWDAGGRRVSERKRISIDAGSNMSRAESTFRADGTGPLQVGIGIGQRAGDGNVSAQEKNAGWMTYWQAPDRDRGSIGCAVVLTAGAVSAFTMESGSVPAIDPLKQLKPGIEGLPPVGNMLAVTPAELGQPLVYYFGAGWSKSGDFPDHESWDRYVARFAQRLKAPLLVDSGR